MSKTKGFIENNPNKISRERPTDNLSGTAVRKNTEVQKESQVTIEPVSTPPETPKNTSTGKKGQKYLSLDITDYQDYISLMAEHEKNKTGKFVSQTQYILRLIEADKQKNIEIYEKLEQIEKMKRELI